MLRKCVVVLAKSRKAFVKPLYIGQDIYCLIFWIFSNSFSVASCEDSVLREMVKGLQIFLA